MDFYTSSKPTLISYKSIASLLQLNRKDKLIDIRLLNDSYLDVCYYIGRPLEVNRYRQDYKVSALKVCLCQFPIEQVNEVYIKINKKSISLDKKEYTVDKKNNCILFTDENYNGKTVSIDYSAGFNENNLPDDLKEACVKLFINKYSMYKKAADYTFGDEMEDIIEEKLEHGIIDADDFFDKFSTIPNDVLTLLDKYKS